MRAGGSAALGALGAAVALHAAPALTARGPGRRALPVLSGRGRPGGVALTFDDGPHPDGTPAVLEVLRHHGWQATFFLLGAQVRRFPDVARRVVAEGHEVAVHGDGHRNHLLLRPAAARRDLLEAQRTLVDVTGTVPRWFRPPYGVLTAGSVCAARQLGLRPVLWTAWGRDWAGTEPATVAGTVLRGLRERGCVLLHDSDVVSTAGSWRSCAEALPLLAAAVDRAGWQVRRLDDHLADR